MSQPLGSTRKSKKFPVLSLFNREFEARDGFDRDCLIRQAVCDFRVLFRRRACAAVAAFETDPGRQMQVDFATIRRGHDRLSVFIATLGWSRATYVEFVTDERLETVLGCHERAFYFFGGFRAKCCRLRPWGIYWTNCARAENSLRNGPTPCLMDCERTGSVTNPCGLEICAGSNNTSQSQVEFADCTGARFLLPFASELASCKTESSTVKPKLKEG